jgi:hypothetical protein
MCIHLLVSCIATVGAGQNLTIVGNLTVNGVLSVADSTTVVLTGQLDLSQSSAIAPVITQPPTSNVVLITIAFGTTIGVGNAVSLLPAGEGEWNISRLFTNVATVATFAGSNCYTFAHPVASLSPLSLIVSIAASPSTSCIPGEHSIFLD